MEGSDREIVQRAFEAFGRGDIDGVVELCDPDIVVRDPERTGTTFRGLDGLRQFFAEWMENWEEYRSEPVDITEAEGEILVRAHQTGKGKLSGIEIFFGVPFGRSIVQRSKSCSKIIFLPSGETAG